MDAYTKGRSSGLAAQPIVQHWERFHSPLLRAARVTVSAQDAVGIDAHLSAAGSSSGTITAPGGTPQPVRPLRERISAAMAA